MTIELTINDKELRRRIKESPELADDFLDSMSDEIISEWKLSMQQTTKSGQGSPLKKTDSVTGRQRQARGRFHYPSLPGNSPAIDFGNLINSLHYEKRGDAREFRGAEYGLYLDQEGDRPFIEEGMKQVRDSSLLDIARAVWGD